VKVILGLDYLVFATLYGYALAAQPRFRTPVATRVADWTFRQPMPARYAVAFAVWLVWMTGIYLFATGTAGTY
jgi:hypothetical protein